MCVSGEVVGEIDEGLLLLVGIAPDDDRLDFERAARKVVDLRIFEDQHGKMNLSLRDHGGGILAVSQFTLYGDVRKGRRPSFVDAADPERAARLFERFVEALRSEDVIVETGVFGARMKVSLVNHGPVTLILDLAAEPGSE